MSPEEKPKAGIEKLLSVVPDMKKLLSHLLIEKVSIEDIW